jgi:hypothetical protein
MASGVKDWRTVRNCSEAACIMLGALLLFEMTKLADTHVPGHEEWNDVRSASKNQYSGQCCDFGNAQLVAFDDWRRTIDQNYEVYLLRTVAANRASRYVLDTFTSISGPVSFTVHVPGTRRAAQADLK